MANSDGITWHAFARVYKYDADVVDWLKRLLGYEPKAADFERFRIKPNGYAQAAGNVLCAGGVANLTALLVGSGGQALSSTTRALVGVGSSSTAASASDTKLGADGGSAWYQAVDSAPTRITMSQTDDTIQCVSTFTTNNGNFAWNEWGWGFITSGASITSSATLASCGTGATLINHKVPSPYLGTKENGSWVLTTTVQFK